MSVYLYLDRDTVFHRMDPRAKMLMLAAWFVLAFVFMSPWANLIILLAELIVVTLSRSWSNVQRFWGLLLIILIATTVMFGLIQPGETQLIGFIEVESVIFGITIGFRVVALIVAGLIFLSTTSNEELLIGLVRLKVPYRFAFALSTALRLVPTVLGTAQVIMQAQRSRGLDIDAGNIVHRLKNMAPIVIPVFISTIRSTQVFSMALESKGFGAHSKRTFLLNPKFGGRDFVTVSVMVLMVAGATWLRVLGVGMSLGM
ncbi:energy-coupling factor transporter transmembrane component T family protein [Brachybacterium vulturis]|uniref:energy-coupling factor transporter transmembrane component T family protein n=1 Tax=Brachybacterium vulturis TaxID=2017484 RepID=UPI003734D8E5